MCTNRPIERLLKVFCEIQENRPSHSDNLKWLEDYSEDVRKFKVFIHNS